MVALQIRDVPAEVRDILATQARLRGQSLQAYLLDLVTMQARRASTVARILEQFEGRSDGSRLARRDAGRFLEKTRSERDRRSGEERGIVDHDPRDHDAVDRVDHETGDHETGDHETGDHETGDRDNTAP
jgi:antitoxin FitA